MHARQLSRTMPRYYGLSAEAFARRSGARTLYAGNGFGNVPTTGSSEPPKMLIAIAGLVLGVVVGSYLTRR